MALHDGRSALAELSLTPEEQSFLDAYWQHGVDQARFLNWEQGQTLYAIEDWFQERFRWLEQRFSIKDRDAGSIYNEWKDLQVEYDPLKDDFLWEVDGADKQRKLMGREWVRILTGFWRPIPFLLEEHGQAWIDEQRKKHNNRYWGHYMAVTPSHYFLMNYIPQNVPGDAVEMTDDGQGAKPTFFRVDTLAYDLMDAMKHYVPDSMGRTGLYEDKCRGSRYTSRIRATLLKSFICRTNRIGSQRYYKSAALIDTAKKSSMMSREMQHDLKKLPKWMLPRNWELYPPETDPGLVEPLVMVSHQKEGGSDYELKEWNEVKMRPDDTKGAFMLFRLGSESALETMRLDEVMIDEKGNYERYDIHKVMVNARDCTRSGSSSGPIGCFWVGGTSSEGKTPGGRIEQNNEVLQEVALNPTTSRIWNVVVNFTPRWRIDGALDDAGWINEVEARQRCEKILSDYRATGNTKLYAAEIVKNPIDHEDCYYMPNLMNDGIPRERIEEHLKTLDQWIREGQRPILNDNNEIDHYEEFRINRGWFKLDPTNVRKPIFEPDPEGGWFISEMPPDVDDPRPGTPFALTRKRNEPALSYVMGCDNAKDRLTEQQAIQAQRGHRDLSKQAFVVLSMATKQVAAIYAYRSANLEDDWEQSVLGALFWNCPMLIETNIQRHLDWVMREYNARGHVEPGTFNPWVMPTPYALRLKTGKIQYGVKATSNKQTLISQHIVPYVSSPLLETVMFPELLKGIAKWNILNDKRTPDLGMALLWALVAYHELDSRNHRVNRVRTRGKLDVFLDMARKQRLLR